MVRKTWIPVVVIGASLLAAPVSVAEAQGGTASPVEAEEGPLEVTIDKDTVDLEQHRLEVRMSRRAGHVKIKVLSAAKGVLAEDDIDFNGRAAGTPLVVTWTPSSEEPVARIEVFAFDTEGNYKGIAITPWSLAIPHEEVNFPTNSAEISVIRPIR